jgi:hypothetical protein
MQEDKLKCLCYLDINNLFHRFKKLDFIKLREFIKSNYEVIRCTAYNSIDYTNQNQVKFNTYLSNNNYRVEAPDISTMTNVDPMIIHQICKDVKTFDHKVIVIIACDGGYSWTLNEMAKDGYIIHVISSKGNTHLNLIGCADKITYLEEMEPKVIL